MRFHRSLSILILFVMLFAPFQTIQALNDVNAEDEPPWRAVLRPGSCTKGSIDTTPHLVGSNGIIYFEARDGYENGASHGDEIWRSDGSENGTWQVTNLTADASPAGIDLQIVFDNRLYFTNDRPEGDWLWVTDGAPVEDGKVGAVHFNYFWPPSSSGYHLDAFTIMGRKLYFIVQSPGPIVSRSELWVTDGTATGTHIVKALNASAGIYKMVVFNDALYFNAVSPNGINLWRSDGTGSGTVDFTRFSNTVTNWSGDIAVAGSQLYFTGVSGSQEILYRTDGASATFVDVFHIPAQGNLRNMVAAQDRVYFDLTQEGYGELWRTDGSPASTQRVKRFGLARYNPGPENLTFVGNTLYFLAIEDYPPYQVWRTDGTEPGTVRMTGYQLTSDDTYYFNQLTAFGDKLYFFGRRRSITANQLWMMDGSPGGTRMLLENSYEGEQNYILPDIEVSGSRLFLVGALPCLGSELLSIDAPGASPQLSRDINKDLAGLIVYPGMAEFKGNTYFIANDFIYGNEMWRSDGSVIGANLFMDLNPMGSAIEVDDINMQLKVAGETLYFTVSNPPTSDRRLWQTDGTTQGTRAVLAEGGYPPQGTFTHPVAYQNKLIFFQEGVYPSMWVSDGTRPGTKTLSTVPESADGVEFNQKMYFLFENHETTDLEFWESDGTFYETQRIKTIDTNLSTFSDKSYPIAPFQGSLYFCVRTSSSMWWLWSSDGTSAGTAPVAMVGSGPDCSVLGGRSNLFVVINNGAAYYQIYTLNDARDGITSLRAVYRTLKGYSNAGDRLFFRESAFGSNSEALWTSDGTIEGTLELISDSGPVRLKQGGMVGGSQYFFIAEDANSGVELWKTDGTVEGTQLAADVWPGINSSSPLIISADSRHLWFLALEEQTTARANNLSLFAYDLPWVPVPEPKMIYIPITLR